MLLIRNAEPCEVIIMVGNKDTLKSTHKGNLRFNNLVFMDVHFVPGLLQTLISEPQLEKKGCKKFRNLEKKIFFSLSILIRMNIQEIYR